jgi:hypothetical protein
MGIWNLILYIYSKPSGNELRRSFQMGYKQFPKVFSHLDNLILGYVGEQGRPCRWGAAFGLYIKGEAA